MSRFRSLPAFLKTQKTIPLWLLLFCGLSFGLLSPWLGFYWDDWPLAWFADVLGPEGFIGFAPQRPFSGVLYFLSSALLGTRPIAWQLYALFWRWVAAVLFWVLLRLSWPEGERLALVGAVLFVVYPGFSQQSIALIYSLYFIYYSLFLASLVVMLLALRTEAHYWPLTAGAVLLSSAAMLSTEYFYGLEMLRILFVAIVVFATAGGWQNKLVRTARHWLPYALLMVIVFVWRFNVADEVSYGINVFDKFAANPSTAASYYTRTILGDVYEATVLAWGLALRIANLAEFGLRIAGLYWGAMLLGAGLAYSVIWWRAKQSSGAAVGKGFLRYTPLLMGLVALLVGGLSFWITDLPLRLGYPWDRGFLPMAFGSVLVMSWLLTQLPDMLAVPRVVGIVVVGLVVGLGVGFHYQTGTAYLRAWRTQRDLFQQLYWRAPGLARDTIVLSPELNVLRFYTDNSLTGPLNLMFAPEYDPSFDGYSMPYFWNFVGEGWGLRLPEFEEDRDFELDYRFFTFDGNTSRSIVLHYEVGQCLRVLEPAYDADFPKLPEELIAPLLVSSPGEVIAAESEATWPGRQFGAEAVHGWCYQYQRADLARQLGEWDIVVEIGDDALAAYEPMHAAELVPFIYGYAKTGDYERADELSWQAYEFRGDERMQAMLCAVWMDIGVESEAALRIFEELRC